MPKFVRTHSLLIYKEFVFSNLRDLSHPLERDAEKRLHNIGDDHARIHLFRIVRGNFEA